MNDTTHHPVVIVGAGFAGLALAYRLDQAGLREFVMLERGGSVGGVWRDNTYPGCACDVPSALYSLSFAPNPDWSRTYATQPEILAYIQRVAREHELERHIRFDTELLAADWDEPTRRWCLQTSTGPFTADVLIAAMGPFGEAIIPDVPGRERFAGASFHSATWDHERALAGERVAVIGTGASAVQFVPAIQPEVAELVLFQRTPPWILPRFDRRTSALQRTAFRALPATQTAMRAGIYGTIECLGLAVFVDQRFRHLYEAAGRWQLRRQVRDPQLRARLTPDYMLGCKRAILTDAYFPTFNQDNVRLVTEDIAEITERGVRTASGAEHEVDVIIWGTGFDAPSRRGQVIRGRDGRSLVEVYDERPRSYLGTTLHGFPNLFTIIGPYSAAGNQSALFTIESQARYIVSAIETMRAEGAATVEVRPDVQDAFVREMERRSARTVWERGGCRSYYQTPSGRNAGLWPNWSFMFAWLTRRFDARAYDLLPAEAGRARA